MTETAETGYQIDETFFATPYEGIRGTVIAFMPIKGKLKRIAHATVFTDRPPSITIETPKSLPLEQIEQMANHLKAFANKVKSHIQE